MKIIYGITKSNFGGAQRYVYDMAIEAKKRGHEVKVLCGQTGALTDKLAQAGIETIPLSSMERDIALRKEIYSFMLIWKILRREKPDVFHVNSSKMGGIGALAGRLAGIKRIIFTGHAWAFNERRPWQYRKLIKTLSWLTVVCAHQTICVSNKTRWDMRKLPFIKNKLGVIRNGIEPFELIPRDTAREELRVLSKSTFLVGTLAELHEIKGLDILINAWSKFIKKYPNSKLVIVGEGEERQNLQNMAENMGISNSIILRGFIPDARTLLSGFDIFVLSSRSEAMPYAVLEAGVASLPVIATSVGGVPEVIQDSINGILIPAENSEAISSSLLLLRENEELGKRLGQALHNTIETKFAKEDMFNETFKLYGNIKTT